MDQYLKGKSKGNKKKRKRNNDTKKTNRRGNKNQTKHRKDKGSSSDTEIFGFNNREAHIYQNKITKKVRKLLCYFAVWLRDLNIKKERYILVNSFLKHSCYISVEERKSKNQRLGNNKTTS